MRSQPARPLGKNLTSAGVAADPTGMRLLGVCLLSAALLLAVLATDAERARAEEAPPTKRTLFAPGTGTTCASYCSQRWYDHPPSARACIRECRARTLTATFYFRGGMRSDRLDCNELLVSPSGRSGCSASGARLPGEDELDFPNP